jgi:DNA-binding IclR family transcriptional regulator
MLGINAVAAPIFDDKDACIGAVALVGSIQFLPTEPDAAAVSALKGAAQQISRKLGHTRLEPPGEMRHSRRRTASAEAAP